MQADVLASFPRNVDELTREFIDAALQKSGVTMAPCIETFDVEVIGVGEGFMGQLARVTLHGRHPGTDLPESLIAKFASPLERTREFARQQSYYEREIGFYRDIGDEAGVPVPRCFFGALDRETYEFCLLIEDLAPAAPSDQIVGTDEAGSRKVVESFAKLHAHWWNSERLAGLDWARPVIEENPLEDGLARMHEAIERSEREGRFDRYPEMKALLRYLPPLFRVKPPPPYPFTLVHGDLRSDNVFFPREGRGRFAVIDWQCCGMDLAARDLARWLVQSISIEQRRRTEEDLLRLYHETLVRSGVTDYSLRRLRQEYKLSIVVMYLMFSMGLDDVDDSPERASELFHAMYERLDAALVDWKVGQLLKVLPLMVPVLKVTTWLRMWMPGRG